MNRRHHTTAGLVICLAIAGCTSGGSEPTPTPAATSATATATPTPTDAPAATPTPSPTSTPSPAGSPSTSETTTDTPGGGEVPGEVVDFGPQAGTVLAVMGVRHDDRLNLRAGPGTDQEVLARLDPTFDDVVAQGTTRDRDGFWYEVQADGTVGWASAAFLAQLGRVDDVTSTVVAELGTTASASSMEELGRIVAESQASVAPESRIRMVVAADEAGDLGEVTYDVVGLGDDALRGVRLHVFGSPTADGFSLMSVEQTLLCDRGVDDGGLCT